MSSTFTTRLGLEKQGDGENPNSWGTILNQNVIDLLDTAIAGYEIVSVSSTGVSLTSNNGSADTSRSFGIRFEGTLTASVTVTIPQKEKVYFIYNNTSGAFGITLKTVGGSAVSVADSGSGMMIACDGININKFTGISSDVSINSIVASVGTFNVVNTSAVSATTVSSTNVYATSITSNTVNTSTVNGTIIQVKGSVSGAVGIQAPTSVTNLTFTLPGTDGTSGQFLQTNGSGILSFASALGRTLNVQGFSSSGTYTKTAGTNSVLVFCAGPSGGGGSGDGGGSTPSAGSGASSFGSHCSAGAGGAGTNGSITNGAPGTRGTASGGIVNVTGGGPSGGAGAIRYRGSDTGTQGSDGGPGALSIAYITSSIGATETVTIGTGGSGGSGTYAGNDGANGWVLVIELA